MSSTKMLKVMHKDKEIEACMDKPSADGNGHCIVLTHGAGSDMNQKALQSAAEAATKEGFACVRFTCKTINLVYRTKVFRSVLEHVHEAEKFKGYFVGGRAMGSRAALGLANDVGGKSEAFAVKGVVCLAYPLHAEGDKEKLNDEPLKALTLPSLFISTEKDKTCDSEILEDVLAKSKTAKIKWVEGPGHFRKSDGRKDTDVHDDMNKIMTGWCKDIMGGATSEKDAEKGEENGDEKKDDVEENGDEKKDTKDRKRKSKGENKDDEAKKPKETK